MVSIVEVTTKAQLRRFVEYPIELYKDVPQYIPGTYDDDLQDWDRKKNPAFEYCQARCWLGPRSCNVPIFCHARRNTSCTISCAAASLRHSPRQ